MHQSKKRTLRRIPLRRGRKRARKRTTSAPLSLKKVPSVKLVLFSPKEKSSNYKRGLLQKAATEIRRLSPENKNALRNYLLNIVKGKDKKPLIVRQRAVNALDYLRNNSAFSVLRKILINPSEELELRCCCARHIGSYETRKASLELFKIFKKEKHPRVREHLLIGIGFSKDKRFVQFLIKNLNNPEWEDRFQSAQALGLIGDKRAIKPLKELFEKEPDGDIRSEIAVALSTFGILEPLIKASNSLRFERGLADADYSLFANKRLIKVEREKPIETANAAVRVFKESTDPFERAQSVRILFGISLKGPKGSQFPFSAPIRFFLDANCEKYPFLSPLIKDGSTPFAVLEEILPNPRLTAQLTEILDQTLREIQKQN